ncbi:AAA family ATPase [Nocardia sp. NPDC048505]|uniref:ParA family protein n=1 Tax=Nocardia sp. NPDC048505 TaxID=3155756 RepID=UPI0033FAE4BF
MTAIATLNKKAIDMAWIDLVEVIAVACDKGGVGKTTTVATLGAALASQGKRVLMIDLNAQKGVLPLDFGIPAAGVDEDGDPVFGDGGESLARAITNGQPLEPIQVPGRENLYICIGGPLMARVDTYMHVVGENEAPTVVAKSLRQSYQGFDYILLDCPPNDKAMRKAAMAAARWVLVPVKSDTGSLGGLAALAKQFHAVRHEYNPFVRMLASFIFDTDMKESINKDGSTTPSKTLAEELGHHKKIVGNQAAVIPHVIPHSERQAKAARQYGMPITELEARAIEEKWPVNDVRQATRLAAAWVKLIKFVLAELACRRIGHPAGMVLRIDTNGNPVYATATEQEVAS